MTDDFILKTVDLLKQICYSKNRTLEILLKEFFRIVFLRPDL